MSEEELKVLNKLSDILNRISNDPKLQEVFKKAAQDILSRNPLDEVNAQISRNIATNHQKILDALINKK